VRYSDYSTFGDTTNGSFKVEWKPINSLLVRASYADIFRAPTIYDLYQAPTASAETFTDPCVGLTAQQVVDNPNFSLACEGVTPDGTFAQPNAQVDAQQIGGAVAGFDLQPEEGEAFTAGFVYQPEALPELSLSVDYWSYSIDDVIQQIDVNVAADTCVQTGAAQFCDLINRFPDGTIFLFVTPTVNLGSLDTDGVDVSVNYAFPTTDIGDFRAGLDGSYTNSYESEVIAGGGVTNVDGYYDRQYGNIAKWRVQGNVGWAWNDFQAQVVTRWIDSVKLSDPDGFPGIQPDLEIASQIYWDLTAGYTLEKTNTKFQLGINNMFDNQPPILFQNNVTNANTDVETYDTIGRFFFGSVTQRF
jgi:iron complex outermembrane recepter protein